MDQQSWWTILVAPASALLGVLIGQALALFSARQQARDAREREQSQLYVELIKSEMSLVLEFLDYAAIAATRISRDFAMLGKSDLEFVMKAIGTLSDSSSVARAHAFSLSEILDEKLREVMTCFTDLEEMCRKPKTPVDEPFGDKVVEQTMAVLQACGDARQEVRKTIMAVLEAEKKVGRK